ncbi:MAG: META domain-containing protein [Gammaproteobacteria bacterium]|nr:META domain-containing protein [Gammaproteobacteria bacterium]
MQKLTSAALTAILAAACAAAPEPAAAPDLAGTNWLAEDIDNLGVLDYARTTLSFQAPDQAVGNAGCNRFFGGVSIVGYEIEFGMLGTTRRACGEALMDQEIQFLRALSRTIAFRLDTEQQLLYFIDENGTDIVRFSELTE